MSLQAAIIIMLTIGYIPSSHSAKVLMLPLMGSIHSQAFGQLGGALIEKGHDVQSLANGDCESIEHLKRAKVKLINYNNTLGGCIMESPQVMFTINMALHSNDLNWMEVFHAFTSISTFLKSEMKSLLSDDRLVRMLRLMKFDMVIVDGIIFNRYAYVLAYRLGKPIVSLQTFLNPYEAGIPALPSLYPSKHGLFTQELGFTDRLANMFGTCFYFYVLPWLTFGSVNQLVSQYAPDMPYSSLSAIASQTNLWLVLKDDIIDFPTITAPNVVYIGGLNTQPALPLNEELKSIADSATDGLIIVSFDSDITLPAKVNKMILLALGQVKQTVIIKTNEEQIKGLTKNIHQLPWIPQNDLLGHPNTRLLITTCEGSSQFEALYQSVPMIALPVFGDQIHNAHRIAHHGMGIMLNIKTLTSSEFIRSIREVISNKKYKENCMKRAEKFRSRPMTAIQRAIYWIEYVMKYGGEDLRPTGSELGFVQFWCLDLILLAIVMSLALLYIMKRTIKFLWFCCCSRRKPVPTGPKPKKE